MSTMSAIATPNPAEIREAAEKQAQALVARWQFATAGISPFMARQKLLDLLGEELTKTKTESFTEGAKAQRDLKA